MASTPDECPYASDPETLAANCGITCFRCPLALLKLEESAQAMASSLTTIRQHTRTRTS